MRILSLSLENFRSYNQLSIDFSAGNKNIFIGPNGGGKTNLLEAMTVLSLSKSCLKAEETSQITWNKDFFKVTGETESEEGGGKILEVIYQINPRRQKACYINDVKVNISEIPGQLPTVTFLPQELELFSGSPSGRRSFLDRLLCQVSPEYLRSLVQYHKLLKQRNSLLKRIAEKLTDSSELDLWDGQLCEKGGSITLKRIELLEVLQCSMAAELSTLGEKSWQMAELKYERKTSAVTESDITDQLREILKQNREKDILLQATGAGPHREDWNLWVNGRRADTFASRGQERTAVVALLLLQVSYLEIKKNEKPVILLDDVFSELDEKHQSSLLENLKEHQVFITCTHLPEKMPAGIKVWEVEEGRIKEF